MTPPYSLNIHMNVSFPVNVEAHEGHGCAWVKIGPNVAIFSHTIEQARNLAEALRNCQGLGTKGAAA